MWSRDHVIYTGKTWLPPCDTSNFAFDIEYVLFRNSDSYCHWFARVSLCTSKRANCFVLGSHSLYEALFVFGKILDLFSLLINYLTKKKVPPHVNKWTIPQLFTRTSPAHKINIAFKSVLAMCNIVHDIIWKDHKNILELHHTSD